MKFLVVVSLCFLSQASLANSLVTTESKYNFSKTVELLKAKILDKKFSIFSEIDHQKGATKVNLDLKKNTLIIFGNPKGGTPLMQENSLMGIELPLKLLITEETGKIVKVSFKDPRPYAKEYGLKKNEARLEKIFGALKGISKTVSR